MATGEKRKKRKRDFFILKYLALTIIILVAILFKVWGRLEGLAAGYRIRERTKRGDELIEEKEALLLEVGRLKSPERLERIAREELGLVAPPDGKSIRRITLEERHKGTK